MLDRLMSYFDTPADKKENKPVEKTPFTTSEDIVKAVNPKDPGICWPLVNLYTKYQLGAGSKDFMQGTSDEIYQTAITEREHQLSLNAQGKDGVNSAFTDSGVDYTPAFHKVEEMKTDVGVRNALGTGSNAIITFQIEGNTQTGDNLLHQIAIGKDRTQPRKYYFFDPNIRGGERIGQSEFLFFKTAKTIKENISPTARQVLVATH